MKEKCEAHATERALARYRLHLTKRIHKTLVNKITGKVNGAGKREAVFVDRQTLTRTRWFVWHEGRWLPVVYSKEQKTIVTILPKGYLGEDPLPLN